MRFNVFQISDAATKEYNLEKSMLLMVEEWSDMEFSIEPYGETGTYTLSSVDSIQVTLLLHFQQTGYDQGIHVKKFNV